MPKDKWDLFNDLLTLRERINQLFDDSMMRGKAPLDMHPGGAWQPPVDAWETEHEIVITAEIPGVDVGEIEVKLDGGALTFKGESRVDPGGGQAAFHRMERLYGAFFRSFTLPDAVDAGGITASSTAGVLRVRLPKKKKTKARTISVK
jgi:HSP20 family protein